MDLNLLCKGFPRDGRRAEHRALLPEEVGRMLNFKTEIGNLSQRETRKAVVRDQGPEGGRRAPASIPCPKPEGTGGCKERG